MDRLFPEEQEQIEELEQKKVKFPGTPERPKLYEVLQVTKRENPLMTADCRREAAKSAVMNLSAAKGLSEEQAVQKALEHAREIQAQAKQGELSYADYLKHIVECRGFCRPLVAHLINCHVLAVSNHDHGIVLFEYDSDDVGTYAVHGVVQEVAQILLRDPERRVLLIGRASRTGELRYNRRLSGRRALAVNDVLVEKGIEPSRIRSMWFGWEEPQIDEWIAQEYGLGTELPQLGKLQMNQSVMMVLY